MIKKYNNNIYDLVEKLYPICRSITGDGVRETLSVINNNIPIQIYEVPTGTKVFDWTIPDEWNITEAFIEDLDGNRIIDFNNSNLHVVNYSSPIDQIISFEELKPHLHTLPEHPDWIPYRTTYYTENWGFCLSHNDLQKMNKKKYRILINSNFKKGSLTYGEYFKQGEINDEVLISTHICHPSMCNDNLSGIAVAAELGKYLSNITTRYSYRIIFIPATIGSITWLAKNEDKLHQIKYGIVAALLGDKGIFNYKKSRNGNSKIDKIVEYVLSKGNYEYNLHNFTPYGYDERQFCSPGINLPMGTLMRTPNKQFAEYHTSADNLSFISGESLKESLNLFKDIVNLIENNQKYINLFPKGEPQLGRRGIYNSIAGNISEIEYALLWILNYSDGQHDLIDISVLSEIDILTLGKAANLLLNNKLITTCQI